MEEMECYGLEMLWKLEKSTVTSKSDLMMLLVHWFLTKNGFRNVGIGDDKTLDNSIEKSELLPEGWNGNNTSYALRYAKDNELYILHGTLSNGTMILNLLQGKTLQVSNAAFNLESTIRSFQGPDVRKLITEVNSQITRINEELVKPICDAGSKSSGTQTNTQTVPATTRERSDPDRWQRDHNPEFYMPPRIGQADLDPLGRLGGGMLMDPMRNPRPFLQYIPGARIDPIGPNVNRNNRNAPDPDHLIPPGYDDMFM